MPVIPTGRVPVPPLYGSMLHLFIHPASGDALFTLAGAADSAAKPN